MANKKDLKEIVSNYILENYSKKKVEEQDMASDDQLGDIDPQVLEARKALFGVSDERLVQSLRDIVTTEQVGQLMVQMLDFINRFTPAPNLDRDLAIKFIQGTERDRDFDASKREVEPEVDIEIDAEEETVDEMSTTAGAPAPATKYAFKRKKK